MTSAEVCNFKIRFNTERGKTDQDIPAWRVLINGIEHEARDVKIEVPCITSKDEIAPGLWKWHISCSGRYQFDQGTQIYTIF
jgi:hypothetical protein